MTSSAPRDAGREFVDDIAGVGLGHGQTVELGYPEPVAGAPRGERFTKPGSNTLMSDVVP